MTKIYKNTIVTVLLLQKGKCHKYTIYLETLLLGLNTIISFLHQAHDIILHFELCFARHKVACLFQPNQAKGDYPVNVFFTWFCPKKSYVLGNFFLDTNAAYFDFMTEMEF